MLADEIDTLSPEVMPVLERLMFEPDVPTVSPEMTRVVPSDLYRLALFAVPVAPAVPDVMALSVKTPPDAAPANGEPHTNSTS